ncbi:MAG: hypothetical protein QOF14_5650 [Hyphomicrobiales bacterium]|jgi:hypothetical protein|nr:hypothetical protein [Hyphomicrobiales bacterium]
MRGKGAIAAYVGRAAQAAALVSFSALAGCNSWYDRHGVRPVIDAEAVVASTANRQRFMDAFVARARLPGEPPPGSSDWYFVMDAGFSYVNEVCDAYVQDLFILNRDRDRLKSGLVILDKAANAIMFATGTSQVAMTIVAQAFGVASGGTDVFANSYLYRIEPSSLQKLIKESQSGYRAAAHARAREFNYVTAVEQGIQGYLSLCLPATIEARVNDVINRTRVVADSTQPAGTVIDLISSTDPVPPRAAVAASQGLVLGRPGAILLDRPDQTIIKQKKVVVIDDPNRLTAIEKSMSKNSIRRLQASLCVTADGDLGPRGSDTRVAIKEFLNARKLVPSETISRQNDDVLTSIVDDVGDCKARGFRNVYEVAVFGPAREGTDAIISIQRRLGVQETGVFDGPTRTAIAKIRDPDAAAKGDFIDPATQIRIIRLRSPLPAQPSGPGAPTGPAPAGGAAPGAGTAPVATPPAGSPPNGTKK